jgi:predicted ATPase
MDMAAQQGARFWELRCAISLARSVIEAGRNAEALAILERACGPLTEGAGIADVRSARDLIAQLRT